MSQPRSTPLRELHEQAGAKMVDFAGWWMPVEYFGLRQEHLHTRANVGLFDVSHMGEIRFRGPKALESLQWLTTNDVSKLEAGQAQYSLLPNDRGGLVDDIIVYCVKPNADYLVCVNAANTEKDFAWMTSHNRGAEITNESDQWGQIAVQGPKAMALIAKLFGADVAAIKPFHFTEAKLGQAPCLVARTGYTGEDGVEIFVPAAATAALWKQLLHEGSEFDTRPIGLGARDTLRTEMKYSLYGHEIDDTTNPFAAGLGWVVKHQQKDFLGKDKIMAAKEAGLKQKLVGFIMTERGIARAGYSLFSFDNKEIGKVTSGTVSPSLNDNIGIGYVDNAFAEPGQVFHVEIRGRRVAARVVKTPFIDLQRSNS